jgi:hypothetical protein
LGVIEDFSAARPCLLQQVNNQHVFNSIFHNIPKPVDLFVAKLIALKVSAWRRKLPATLQIPTTSLFSFSGEIHGTSGQCVFFSLIDAGSVLLPA